MLNQFLSRIVQTGILLMLLIVSVMILSSCGSQTIDQRRPTSVGPSGPPTILPATEPPPTR